MLQIRETEAMVSLSYKVIKYGLIIMAEAEEYINKTPESSSQLSVKYTLYVTKCGFQG